MTDVRLTLREVDFLAMLAAKHTRHTAAGAVGMGPVEAGRLVRRLGLRFDDLDRLRNTASVIGVLVGELRSALAALGSDRPAVALSPDPRPAVVLPPPRPVPRPSATRPSMPRLRRAATPNYAALLGVNTTVVRAWLREQGIPCPDRGVLSTRLLHMYVDAHQEATP